MKPQKIECENCGSMMLYYGELDWGPARTIDAWTWVNDMWIHTCRDGTVSNGTVSEIED